MKIDVNWETILNLKINDYLTTNIIFHLVYDETKNICKKIIKAEKNLQILVDDYNFSRGYD